MNGVAFRQMGEKSRNQSIFCANATRLVNKFKISASGCGYHFTRLTTGMTVKVRTIFDASASRMASPPRSWRSVR